MESIIITTTTQFYEIVESQNENMIYTRQELKEKVEKLQSQNKDYTIFSINDENDGTPTYITFGITWANNLGFYVLEGNFKMPNDLDY